MDTRLLLMARYNAMPIVPLHLVREDFFPHLSLPKFLRKVNEYAIKLPVVRIDNSQKSAKGVHIDDLATYLDERRAEAKRDFERNFL